MTQTTTPTGLSVKETARIQVLIARHSSEIAATGQKLATDFQTSAQLTIGCACRSMGISRLDWEKIGAVQNGWEFEAPSRETLRRWERS